MTGRTGGRGVLEIVGTGARTALGASLAASSAAARAGLCGFADHAFVVDGAGSPVSVAADDFLPPALERRERLARLAHSAAEEASVGSFSVAGGAKVRLLLALSPAGEDGAGRAEVEAIVEAVRHAIGDAEVADVIVDRGGPVAGIAAVRSALSAAANGDRGPSLLLGVDSWLDAAALERLDAGEWLRVKGRPFGFVPGEAAAALWLVPGGPDRRRLRIESCARFLEDEAAIGPDQPRLGRALTAAARAALDEGVPTGADGIVNALYSDLNGTPERADEVGYTVVRLRDRLGDAVRTVTPAEWFGDVGAAGVPLMFALAAHDAARRPAGGGRAMVLAQSFGRDRGAALLSWPNGLEARARRWA